MTWSNAELEYEGLPLLLRKPDYQNILQFKSKFTKLVAIEHYLEIVDKLGLPKKSYNSNISKFDGYMCDLFTDTNDGIVFLIETFNGKRTYYYYCDNNLDIDILADEIKSKFDFNIEIMSQNDDEWAFLHNYPMDFT
jgi:hypothetical protein